MSNYDSERVASILLATIEEDNNIGQAIEKLTELLGSVRRDTLEWTWAEARNGYDRGMIPHQRDLVELRKKVEEDLNPDRE